MARSVGFGVYINNRQPILLGDAYPMSALLETATLAEDLGFDSVWVGDSPLAKPRLEPITTLAAVAARTSRVKLGTSILQPHLRNPMWLALSWATLDIASGGRTILGAGLGAGAADLVRKECEAAGIEKRVRGKEFEKAVVLLRRLWTEQGVSASGNGWRLDEVTLDVLPVQKPHPPIWIGSGLAGERTPGDGGDQMKLGTYDGPFERVARVGDGWFAGGFPSPEDVARVWPRIEAAARALGRDPAALDVAISTTANVQANRAAAWAEAQTMRSRYTRLPMDSALVDRFLVGTPDDCIAKLRRYVDGGATHFMINLQTADLPGQIRLFAKEVLPAFR